MVYAQLIGGPCAGRSIQVPSGTKIGEVIELTIQRERAGTTTIEQKAHYRIEPALDPHRKAVVGNWVNPADRRQYGR